MSYLLQRDIEAATGHQLVHIIRARRCNTDTMYELACSQHAAQLTFSFGRRNAGAVEDVDQRLVAAALRQNPHLHLPSRRSTEVQITQARANLAVVGGEQFARVVARLERVAHVHERRNRVLLVLRICLSAEALSSNCAVKKRRTICIVVSFYVLLLLRLAGTR